MVLLDLNPLPSWTPFAVAVLMLVVLGLLWLAPVAIAVFA